MKYVSLHKYQYKHGKSRALTTDLCGQPGSESGQATEVLLHGLIDEMAAAGEKDLAKLVSLALFQGTPLPLRKWAGPGDDPLSPGVLAAQAEILITTGRVEGWLRTLLPRLEGLLEVELSPDDSCPVGNRCSVVEGRVDLDL